VEPADVEDLCEAGASFGLTPEAILPAYGMAETTVAVSFSECGAGLVVDEVDADLLAVLRRAVPAAKGNTTRLATLGPVDGLEARVVDEVGNLLPTRGVTCPENGLFRDGSKPRGPPSRHRLGPRDMTLEAKRSRHVTVGIPKLRITRVVAVSPRQKSPQPQQPDVAYHKTLIGWRGR
jgi:acyl-CoA synthetase (AMP-forming)/AMP-acid ligase II